MRRLLALAALSCVLFGCATAYKISDIRTGMSRAEVVTVLGNPAGTGVDGDREYLNYKLLESAHDWGPTPYTVVLQDGKVVSFGRHGQVR